jgi:hypothetical protein
MKKDRIFINILTVNICLKGTILCVNEHKAQDKTQTTENTTQYRKLRQLAADPTTQEQCCEPSCSEW